jgi:Secretion system C-terminal sorting domain
MIRNSTLTLLVSFFLCFKMVTIHAATITSVGTGAWNNPASWDIGIPTINDDVVIAINHKIDIGLYDAKCNKLSVNGTLDLASSYSYSFLVNNYAVFNVNSILNMSGGQIIVVGNGSIPLGIANLDVTNISTLNTTGGTIYIMNPNSNGEPCIRGAKEFGNTVSLGLSSTPIFNTDFTFASSPNQPIFKNLEVNFDATTNSTKARLKNLIVKGAFGVNRGHFINAGPSEKIFVGGNFNIGDMGIVEGDVEFNGADQQNINPLGTNMTVLFKGNLTVNANRVKIKLNLEIPNPYVLNLGKGIFDAGSFTLTLNSPPVIGVTPLSKTKFISTHDLYGELGTLKIKNMTGATLFPVGYEMGAATPRYAPVIITPSVSSDFSVTVQPKNSIILSVDSLKQVWEIRRNNAATANITFQWDTDDEEGNFSTNRNNCKIYHYSSGTWSAISGLGVSTNGTTHTKTVTNVSSFSPFTVLTTATLPVSLTEFKAKAVSNRAILTWSTANEINNQGFDIERSLDGNQFDKIGFVKGNGNSNILLSYIFSDENFTQTAFYRLKQIDFDGKIEYSRIVQLEKTKTGTIKVYPNPITSNANLNVEFASESRGVVDITLMDVSGRIIFQNKYDATSSLINIPTQDLASGLYIVKVLNGLNVNIQKIIKD